jgi:hypothetical protein
LAVCLFLYRKDHVQAGGECLGYTQHGVVVAQLITVGIMLGIAFLLLGYGLLSAQGGPHAIGIWGLVLLGVVIFVALISGLIAAGMMLQWCGDVRKGWEEVAAVVAGRDVTPVADTLIAARKKLLAEEDKIEPILKNVREVFQAQRIAVATVTEATRLRERPGSVDIDNEQRSRVKRALNRVANAMAEAMLDQALAELGSKNLIQSRSTKSGSYFISSSVADIQLFRWSPSLAGRSNPPPNMDSTRIYTCHGQQTPKLVLPWPHACLHVGSIQARVFVHMQAPTPEIPQMGLCRDKLRSTQL